MLDLRTPIGKPMALRPYPLAEQHLQEARAKAGVRQSLDRNTPPVLSPRKAVQSMRMPLPSFRPPMILRIALAMATLAQARAFHFDATTGKDGNTGTSPAQAVRTLALARSTKFVAGDSLLFARGGHWSRDSLFLSAQGTAKDPIVVGAYGDPSQGRPHLENSGYLVVLNKASHVVVQDLELSGARGGCVEMWDSTVSHITVRRMDIHDCGGGVYMTGTGIQVLDNLFHDGKMVVNTKDVMDDDYGASGIGFSRLDGCLVRGNRLWNLVAPSYDYGVDGGAMEFWKTVRHCEVSGNFAYEVDGFSEFGGQKGDSVVDVSLHHNVSLESGPLACFHMADPKLPFGIGYDSVRLDNNLSLDRSGKAWSFHVLADGGTPDRPDRIRIRNNLFVTDSANLVWYQQDRSRDPTWVHAHNLVWNRFHDPFAVDRLRGLGEVFGHPGFGIERWDSTATVDTALATYGLLPRSPANGTGMDLGYAVDFFGRPAASGGVVDRGPFAHGTFAGFRSRTGSARGGFIGWDRGTISISMDQVGVGALVELRGREASGGAGLRLASWQAGAGRFERSVALQSRSGVVLLDLLVDGIRRDSRLVLPVAGW